MLTNKQTRGQGFAQAPEKEKEVSEMLKGMWLGLAMLAVCVLVVFVGCLNAQTQAVSDTGKVPKIAVQDTSKASKIAVPDTGKVPNAAAKTEEKHLPIWVNQAIRLGQSEKVRPYRFHNIIAGDVGNFTTPFLRVEIAASEAKEKLMVFVPSDVTEEMLAPVLIVTVYPFIYDFSIHYSAKHVVIKKQKSSDPADAIQPTTIKPYEVTANTAGGGKVTENGVVATFPLDALRAGNEFAFLYTNDDRMASFKIDMKMISETMRF